ncbi:MAG: alcohol dehydrogenase catalytic domain-containing protein [Elusimicrobia bacterium]|nr:alcohol dehydrogenase catalytic domain-containing protein [Elusimicrobiota bacterium]
MKAIIYDEREGPALREVPAPEPEEGGAVLSVEACGLCGTDLLKLAEKKAGAVLGHEIVGRVAKTRAPYGKFKEGERVVLGHHVPCGHCHYCRRDSPSMCAQFKATNVSPGGFSEMVRVSALHLDRTVVKISEDLDAAAACQIEPLACCVRNVRRLGLSSGDAAAVVGLGSIGLLSAQLLRLDGVRVFGLDLDPGRLKAAAPWMTGYSDARELEAAAKGSTAGRGLDAAVITAGPADLARQSLSWLRHGGTLNIFAAPKPSDAVFDLDAIYHRELRVLASYSATPEDLRRSAELVSGGQISLSPIASGRYALEDFSRAVDDARARRVMKAILVPR